MQQNLHARVLLRCIMKKHPLASWLGLPLYPCHKFDLAVSHQNRQKKSDSLPTRFPRIQIVITFVHLGIVVIGTKRGGPISKKKKKFKKITAILFYLGWSYSVDWLSCTYCPHTNLYIQYLIIF